MQKLMMFPSMIRTRVVLLIYFQSWRKKDIVTHLADRLAPGGMMVLGVGEVIDWQRPDMERIQYKDTLAFVKRNHS